VAPLAAACGGTVHVLVIEYLAPLERIDELRPAHVEYLQRHYDDGTFLVSGRQDPPVGGLILATDVDRARLDEIVATDPFVTGGAAEYRVVAFGPTMVAPGLRDALAAAGVALP
jgi:uncharacterized protein YciI